MLRPDRPIDKADVDRLRAAYGSWRKEELTSLARDRLDFRIPAVGSCRL